MTFYRSSYGVDVPAQLTVAELYQATREGMLAESERVELIDGYLLPFPSTSGARAKLRMGLSRFLVRSLPNEMRAYVRPSLVLDATTLLELDMVVAARDCVPPSVAGSSVALAIDIVDQERFARPPLYARFGIRDLWVVDSVRQVVRVHRAPVDGAYTDVHEYSADEAVAPLMFPDLPIRLDRLD